MYLVVQLEYPSNNPWYTRTGTTCFGDHEPLILSHQKSIAPLFHSLHLLIRLLSISFLNTKTIMEHPLPQITVVFSSELTQALSEHRLPPTYVGVRRIRPSATVTAALQSQSSSERSKVTFTIADPETGIERRMTRQEKKQLKLKLRQEQVSEKKLRRQQQLVKEEEEAATAAAVNEKTKKRKRISIPDFLKGDQYYNLPINVAALEQELADLAGERNRVPPVAVGPPMTRLLLNRVLPIVVDHDLAQLWAVFLKESMKDAEIVRQAEDMRALVYDVVPSVWTRMRPESLGSSTTSSSSQSSPSFNLKDGDLYSTFPLASSSSRADLDRAAVIQALHCGTHLHVSCGAKFGGDYLIYEAPRDECHAFAGLRVLSSSNTDAYPIPTAYDMTGYVRCLHTAAKLALLAMVQERTTIDGTLVYHVAFVELALIKVGSTTRR